MNRLIRFLFLFILLAIVSCNSKDGSPEYNRVPLLENLSSNLIIPGYNNLSAKAQVLKVSAETFETEASLSNLEALRTAWLDAYKAYQQVAFYNFGPAEQVLLNMNVNTFPTDKTLVENNISSGTYNIGAVSNFKAKGFSALDYLLFGTGENDDAILAKFTTAETAQQAKKYVVDIASDIAAKSSTVATEWTNNYKAIFISRTGKDVSSSLGLLINASVQYLERDIRDNKIGIPLGIRSLDTPIPNNSEALHARQSVALATQAVSAFYDMYLGKSQSNGEGLDDALRAVNARYNGGSLADVISTQFQLAIDKVSAIPEPFSETVKKDSPSRTTASQAYLELQKLMLLLKADMVSSLGVSITYQDNDGD